MSSRLVMCRAFVGIKLRDRKKTRHLIEFYEGLSARTWTEL